MTVQLPEDHAFYSVKETADVLKCSERTVYRYVQDGTLEAKRGPTQLLIIRDSLQAFIDSLPDVGGAA